MDKKTATMVGAAAALAAGPAIAQAAASEPAVPVAASYAELLQPIPNATERLKLADAEQAAQQAQLIEAQYYQGYGRGYQGYGRGGYGGNYHHHHHHNHYRYSRAWYLAHGYMWYGNRWILRRLYHHHHHHHHNHY